MLSTGSLRALFYLDPNVVYLNHGAFGATPREVLKVHHNWQREMEHQPVEFLERRYSALMLRARSALADFLGTDEDNLVYTQNATTAMNIVSHSLPLEAGDEVLCTSHEYGAIARMWQFLSRQHGYSYISHDLKLPLETPLSVVEDLWKAVTSHTRVICVSHITSPTAVILPVRAIVERARSEGIMTVIDGAHAPGQIPLDLHELDADFYCGSLHKWLFTPKGTGFLYARPSAQKLLRPLVVSWGTDLDTYSGSPFVGEYEWLGTRDVSSFLTVPSALEFFATNKWDAVRSRCHELACWAQSEICRTTGSVVLHSPNDYWFSQMFTTSLPGDPDLPKMKFRLLNEYHIEVPLIEWTKYKLLRVSIQGYNSKDDVCRLIEAVRALLRC